MSREISAFQRDQPVEGALTLHKDSLTSYLLRLAGLVWAVAVGPLAFVLLFVAVTALGRLFAITAIVAALLPAVAHAAWRKGNRRRAAVAVAMFVGVCGGSAFLIARVPGGKVVGESAVRSLYVDGANRPVRHALGNVLPEVDQLMLGFTLMPMMDPLFTRTQASRLKKWTAAIYRELDSDASFAECGSAMPLAYDELFGMRAVPGHAFLYVPPTVVRTKPAPVLIFMHGSGGNFKAYLWLLSRLADRLNFVVLAPSSGLGNWRWPETNAVVAAALAAAERHVSVAHDNLHVMGLSNGGLAVCQLARTSGAKFRSMIFLSPVFDDECIRAEAFGRECRRNQFYVLTGGLDDRVPVGYVREYAEEISKHAAKVSFEVEEGADHFLFFSHADRVVASLEKWLRSTQ
jgi:pimeloyl-ACP methyl ester carboxylesterase